MINPWKRIEVNHFIVRHPRVDHRTEGMRVAHITDIHLGRWVKPRHVEALSHYVNQRSPDLTVLTGDYVGYSRRDISRCADALGHLEGPVFATLGNHDHWASTEASVEAFERAGIPLLNNTSHPLTTPGGHQLRVIGVDDAVTKRHDVEAAFSGVDDDAFRLTLCHVPDLSPRVARAGADLILSGHTHGLQFNVPRLAASLATKLGMRYIEGAYTLDARCMLYVSRGLGSASWPWRYRAAPELAFFRLEAGEHPELVLEHRLHASLGAPARRARLVAPDRQGAPVTPETP